MNIDIDKSNNLTATGRIVQIKSEEKGAYLKSLVDTYNSLHDISQKVISNDGKIIGSERSILLEKLELLLLYTITAVFKIEDSEEDFTISIPFGNFLNSFILNVHSGQWDLSGQFPKNFEQIEGNFSKVAETRIKNNIHLFLESYRTTSKDGKISPEEKSSLQKILFECIIGIIFLLYQLKICLINN